jgi:hypothetical protein
MAHYDIKGDGELDKMLNICNTSECFCAPVDSILSPSGRHTHIVTLTAGEIKGKIGDLKKIKVGDTIGIGQFNGDQLPTWSRLTDVDVLVDGEPGLVLKMKWLNGFTPAAPVYVDREFETKSTGSGVACVCNHDTSGDLEAISGGSATESGHHLIATFDGTDVANRVLKPTRPVFEVVSLPAPMANEPSGTANHLRGGLVIKLRMNFVDRSQCSQMRVCDCCVDRTPAV